MKKTLAVLTASFIFVSYAAADDNITVSVDNNSSYKPTTIVNGDFETQPWQGFYYNGTEYTIEKLKAGASFTDGTEVGDKLWNGVGEGWNTTETQVNSLGCLFERFAESGVYSSNFKNSSNHCIEMNAKNPSVFYQDLQTKGGDVIRWTLKHARRDVPNDPEERIHVEIGEPETDSSGNLVPATSNADTDPRNSKIKDAGKAIFNYNGVTNSNGDYGFGTTDELTYLTIPGTEKHGEWKSAKGVYIIPSGQNITRFAFISDLPENSSSGNLLDDITFNTLIGNLNAYADWDASVVVSGYWGETDSSKKLQVELLDENKAKLSSTKEISMSSVSGKNFKIGIPATVVTSAKYVKIYHQDYESAAETIEIERHYHESELFGVWNYSDRLPTTGRYALGTDVVLSSDVTLTGNSEMAALGGAKICLNGHTISGANVIVSSGDNKLTITSISTYDDSLGSIEETLKVTGGDFTLNGGNVNTLKVSGGTCTVTGVVNVTALDVDSGKVLTLDSNIDKGSEIYLSATPKTGIFTSGFAGGGLDLGQVINLPSGVTDYLLLKTKSCELKVKQHKSAW